MTQKPSTPSVPTAVRRPFDSSRTRVGPILGGLSEASAQDPQWLRRLLDLAAGPGEHHWQAQNLTTPSLPPSDFLYDGAGRAGMHPPVALLSWLIRTGRFEVYVRPYPDVNSGRWQVSQAGGLSPLWSRNGRELFYKDGAKMLISAAVLPGATFTLGAQNSGRSTARAGSQRRGRPPTPRPP